MKSAAYWAGRMERLNENLMRKADALLPELETAYLRAEESICREIEAFYRRYAGQEGITLAEAKRLLSPKERQRFGMTLEKYIKIGEEGTTDPEWIRQMERTAARARISRLEALRLQMRRQVELLEGRKADALAKTLGEIFKECRYRTAYEIQRGLGVGAAFATMDANTVSKALAKPWAADGKTFSDRIWGDDRGKLLHTLETTLTTGIITGETPQKVIDKVRKAMGSSCAAAGRLVLTESAAFAAMARQDCYAELGVGKYEFLATPDASTCETCAALDGQVFALEDYAIGVTAPPLHPNDRCTTVPHFEDDFSAGNMRAARDGDGKTYYVPAELTYAEWKKAFVEGGSKDGLTVATVETIIKEKQGATKLSVDMFPPEFGSKSELKNTETMMAYVNELEDANPDVIALYSKMGALDTVGSRGIPFSISHDSNYSVRTRCYQSDRTLVDVTLIIPKLAGEDLTGQIITMLHEEMHLMDLYCRPDVKKTGILSATNRKLVALFETPKYDIPKVFDDLFEAFDKECLKIKTEIVKARDAAIRGYKNQYYAGTLLYKDYKRLTSAAMKEAQAAIDYQCRNAMGGGVSSLEDIYDAFSAGTAREAGLVRYGHGVSYYRDVANRCEETLANYGALSVVRPDLIELLRQEEPELVEALDEVIREMLKKGGA